VRKKGWQYRLLSEQPDDLSWNWAMRRKGIVWLTFAILLLLAGSELISRGKVAKRVFTTG